MKNAVLTSFTFNLNYARMLVEDVADDKMCEQPGGVVNHPAWVIGHLATTCDFMGGILGVEPGCPKAWGDLFGNGSTPTTDATKYPSKADLLKALQDGHERLAAAYENADDQTLSQVNPVEALRQPFPTIGDLLLFGVTGHEATHLGQLSAWRRAMGLPSVF